MENSVQLPASAIIRRWNDPLVEALGVSPTSPYVEYCWLPVLGPTATWLYRRLGPLVETGDDGEVDLVDLARGLGISTGLGRHAPLWRSLLRLQRFGAVEWGSNALSVRAALPPLTERQLLRLPPSVAEAHRGLASR